MFTFIGVMIFMAFLGALIFSGVYKLTDSLFLRASFAVVYLIGSIIFAVNV